MNTVKRLLNNLASKIPISVRNKLKNTAVGDKWRSFYNSKILKDIEWYVSDIEMAEISFEEGTFQIPVPEGSLHTRIDEFEPSGKLVFSRLISPQSVVYDVGARAGVYCGLARELGVAPRQIHAFEADRFWFNLLEYSYGREGAKVINASVGDGGDTLPIDEYVKTSTAPSIVKVDVDGAEKRVLDGMKNTLQRHAPDLLVEIHTPFGDDDALQNFGDSVDETLMLLDEIGYELEYSNHRKSSEWYSSLNESLSHESTFLVLARC